MTETSNDQGSDKVSITGWNFSLSTLLLAFLVILLLIVSGTGFVTLVENIFCNLLLVFCGFGNVKLWGVV